MYNVHKKQRGLNTFFTEVLSKINTTTQQASHWTDCSFCSSIMATCKYWWWQWKESIPSLCSGYKGGKAWCSARATCWQHCVIRCQFTTPWILLIGQHIKTSFWYKIKKEMAGLSIRWKINKSKNNSCFLEISYQAALVIYCLSILVDYCDISSLALTHTQCLC